MCGPAGHSGWHEHTCYLSSEERDTDHQNNTEAGGILHDPEKWQVVGKVVVVTEEQPRAQDKMRMY